MSRKILLYGHFLFAFFLFLPNPALSQTFPDPATVLADLDVSVEVTFNPANGVYTYAYTLTSGPGNLREIISFSVDIMTQNPITPVDDPDLINDESFRLKNFASTRSIPVGFQSPPGWLTGVGITGNAAWVSLGAPSLLFPENPSLFPGNSLGGFTIQSKAPPGPRMFTIQPRISDLFQGFGDEIELLDVPQAEDYIVKGETIGPVLAEELVVRGDLNIERARVELLGLSSNRFEVRGRFVVGANSDGIDVLNEDVTVRFDGFSETITAGSFFRDGDDEGFQFNGTSGGITQVNIRDDGGFRVKGRDLELSGIDLNNPVPFSLQIGNDLGETGIPFDDDGRFRQE